MVPRLSCNLNKIESAGTVVECEKLAEKDVEFLL
jgi:hypothetical protein